MSDISTDKSRKGTHIPASNDLACVVMALEDFYQEISSSVPTASWARLAQWVNENSNIDDKEISDEWKCRIHATGQWVLNSMGYYSDTGLVVLQASTIDGDQKAVILELIDELDPSNALWYHLPRDPMYRQNFLIKLRTRIDRLRNNQSESVSGFKVKKRKTTNKSTSPHGKRDLIIAALSKHHKYGEELVLDQTPIGLNEMARGLRCSADTIHRFFKKEFKGHGKYKQTCKDEGSLKIHLRRLNNDFPADVQHRAFQEHLKSNYSS